MNVNPAYTAYTNLGIKEDDKPVAKEKSFGLLSRYSSPKQATPSEPIDRIRKYVTNLRKARKQLTDG
jgi:hypothetical protein